MLKLVRLVGEEIVVGDEVLVIRVTKIRGNRVTIGIGGTGELPVYRRELFEAIKAESGEPARHNGTP